MSSAINDDELSISLPAYDHGRSRPSLPPIMSPPTRADGLIFNPESPGTERAMSRLHQYTVVRSIGEGSFGKVKLARHKVTGQEVAMKAINRRKLISRDMAGRIEREIQYLQLLRHPHIIKLYTVITTKDTIYMVLEYVPMELFDYIVKHGRLREKQARKLFQQIICAVEYCHRHKIVHRDLKPENLLLDSNFNVKIADFGLSNIMTDGNFLKTSCGSPNYAAPEVISGKLYAGPEVDVWSCGVILFVFLAGKLPFDDDFIPNLFKKIQAGIFQFPSHMSGMTGPKTLIQRCLQVHPIHRITIPEIRMDEWFMYDLPAYLVDPVEEFLDTGVDPGKAIDPRQLAPGKPQDVVEKIHESVVNKLGRTMGYNQEDVKDALSKDEPSAIKDAYLIVRENVFMDAPQYKTKNPALESFMASSPPVEPNYPTFQPHASDDIRPLTSRGESHRASRTLSDAPTLARDEDEVPRVSNVRVLNTSLPHVHAELLAAREKAKERKEDPDLVLHPSQVDGDATDETTFPEEVEFDKGGEPLQRPREDQEATSRALKPHSRSVTAMNELRNPRERPEAMTTINPDDKKPAPTRAKPKKWQFGIRSKNMPFEAMKCIFTALRAMDAHWAIAPASASDNDPNGEDRDGQASPPPDLADGERYSVLQSKYPQLPGSYYIPRDPWFIRARILKRGMMMPGEAPALSAHNSSVSLPSEAQHQLKKHLEELGGYAGEDVAKALGMAVGPSHAKTKPPYNSAATSRPNSSVGDQSSGQDAFTGPGQPISRAESGHSLPNKGPSQQVGVWVYVDIQLYMLEQGTYMVDFKCDGYQNVVLVDPAKERTRSPTSSGSAMTSPASSRPVSGFGKRAGEAVNGFHDDHSDGGFETKAEPYWKPTTKRYKNKEKEISSPYPYLDVASDLIAHLAG